MASAAGKLRDDAIGSDLLRLKLAGVSECLLVTTVKKLNKSEQTIL